MKKIKLLKTLLISTIGITVIGTITAVSTSCSSSVVPVTGVSLDRKSLPLGIGDSYTLIATVHPEDATDKSVTWSSSNSSVALVDNNGKVGAVSAGEATITVKTNDGGFTDTCQVTVQIFVTGVSLSKGSLALDVGDSDTLIATVHPYNATDKSVTWTSSDSSIATVDSNGKVTAVSEGSAKITVKTNDGGYEDYCDVTVTYTAPSYICITANADSTLQLDNEGENNPNLKYSIDGSHWAPLSDSEMLNIPANGKIYLIGDNANGWSQGEQTYSHFNITGSVSISGNVMSLLDNGTGTISSIPNDYCFYALFHSSTRITSVSEDFLPATTLTTRCYSNMFIYCSSLTAAPDLPATTLAEDCYTGMFAHCTSLITAPELPATQLADSCYSNMFNGCTSLKNIPNTLPATTLTKSCYDHMFIGCSSLTTAPDLPATTLADSCYSYMFMGCTSLTTAPELPATTLANSCYAHMFYNCTSLIGAPDLPATTLASNCYQGMFEDCTSLIIAPDVLPATKLSSYCYQGMFSYCSSLRIAPALRAIISLADSCYECLFDGCSSLVSVILNFYWKAAEAPRHAFNNWVRNVASVGKFYYKGTDLDPITNFGFPSGWTLYSD